MADNNGMELSIIVPIFNEQDNINALHAEICEAIPEKHRCEIIFIDDGSSDNSFNILLDIRQKDTRVRVIRLRKNFGQTAALSAGFEHSRGNVIVPLDADGQNDPADIPKLVQKLDEGYDIVSGWRKNRKDKDN